MRKLNYTYVLKGKGRTGCIQCDNATTVCDKKQSDITQHTVYSSGYDNFFLLRGNLLTSKNDHGSSHVDTNYPDDRDPTLRMYISELIVGSYQYIPEAHVTNTVYDLTSIKITAANFVGTGCFLIRLYEINIANYRSSSSSVDKTLFSNINN